MPIPEQIEVGGKKYDTASLFSVEIVERRGGDLKLTETDAEVSFPADISAVDLAEAAVELCGLSREGLIVTPSVYIDQQTGLPTVSLPLEDLIGTADEAEDEDDS